MKMKRAWAHSKASALRPAAVFNNGLTPLTGWNALERFRHTSIMAPRSVGRSVGPSEAFWSMLQAQVAEISSETFFSISTSQQCFYAHCQLSYFVYTSSQGHRAYQPQTKVQRQPTASASSHPRDVTVGGSQTSGAMHGAT